MTIFFINLIMAILFQNNKTKWKEKKITKQKHH